MGEGNATRPTLSSSMVSTSYDAGAAAATYVRPSGHIHCFIRLTWRMGLEGPDATK